MIKTIIKLTVFSIFIGMLSLSTAMAGGTKPKKEQPDPPKENPYKKCVEVKNYQFLLKRDRSCMMFLKNSCEIDLKFTFWKIRHLHSNGDVTIEDKVSTDLDGYKGGSVNIFFKEYCSPREWTVDPKNAES